MTQIELANEGVLLIGGLSLIAYGLAGAIAAGSLMAAAAGSFMIAEALATQ
jgi:hypothetical protein